jgi:hypothetical protein
VPLNAAPAAKPEPNCQSQISLVVGLLLAIDTGSGHLTTNWEPDKKALKFEDNYSTVVTKLNFNSSEILRN